jgi:hypothetical protein
MPSSYYKGHYISVIPLPDKSGTSSCISCVEIRYKRDRAPSVRLLLDESFSTTRAASARGLAKGKEWVDQRLAHKHTPSEASGEWMPIRLRVKSWLASLV